MGVDMRSLRLRVGIFGAEPWSENMRQEIEDRLGIKALDIYGLSEIIGPGVAMECAEGRHGLHVFEDHFIVETINPETGENVPRGEAGEAGLYLPHQRGIPINQIQDEGYVQADGRAVQVWQDACADATRNRAQR